MSLVGRELVVLQMEELRQFNWPVALNCKLQEVNSDCVFCFDLLIADGACNAICDWSIEQFQLPTLLGIEKPGGVADGLEAVMGA